MTFKKLTDTHIQHVNQNNETHIRLRCLGFIGSGRVIERSQVRKETALFSLKANNLGDN